MGKNDHETTDAGDAARRSLMRNDDDEYSHGSIPVRGNDANEEGHNSQTTRRDEDENDDGNDARIGLNSTTTTTSTDPISTTMPLLRRIHQLQGWALLVAPILALSAVVTVSVWISALGGLAVSSSTSTSSSSSSSSSAGHAKLVFNGHPLFMIVAFSFMTVATLSFRYAMMTRTTTTTTTSHDTSSTRRLLEPAAVGGPLTAEYEQELVQELEDHDEEEDGHSNQRIPEGQRLSSSSSPSSCCGCTPRCCATGPPPPPPQTRRSIAKVGHGSCWAVAMIAMVLGLQAVVRSHNDPIAGYIANLYSLHSWIGMIVLVIYAAQFVVGITVFGESLLLGQLGLGRGRLPSSGCCGCGRPSRRRPPWGSGLSPSFKAQVLHVHTYLGPILYNGVWVTILLGIQEKEGFVGCAYPVIDQPDTRPWTHFGLIPTVCKLSHLLGLLVLATGLVTNFALHPFGPKPAPMAAIAAAAAAPSAGA